MTMINPLESKVLEIFHTREKEVKKYNKYEFKYLGYEDPGEIYVTISCMYNLNDFISFSFLSDLSELLKTKDISLTNTKYESGCDTCDHGSTSEADIWAYNIPKYLFKNP